MNPDRFAQTLEQLSSAQDQSAERLRPALEAAIERARALSPSMIAEQALDDLGFALGAFGVAALDGGDPQLIEDGFYAQRPDSPLSERSLRLAWLAFVDELGRSGDKPAFGGVGGAEPWAMSARSQPWPTVQIQSQIDEVMALFDTGLHVVSVRGPGRSAFLAKLRRQILAKAGAEALVPPVISAARDDLMGPLNQALARGEFPEEIRNAIPQLRFGEDRLGLLGRAGDRAPVALLLDDAHIQARSIILGLPLFLEPAPQRKALLVLGCPEDPQHDSALSELLADAEERGILTQITLPKLSEEGAEALLVAAYGAEAAPLAQALYAQCEAPRERTRWALAQAWLQAIAEGGALAADAADRLAAGFDLEAYLPEHAGAHTLLARFAVEGDDYFHAFAAAALMGQDLSEDEVEDLLFDDEYLLDGALVGGCERAVPAGQTLWAELPDGLHPAFLWLDVRVPAALRAKLSEQEHQQSAAILRDTLMNGYQPERFWLVAERCWRLDRTAAQPRMVEQLILGTQNAQRIEAGFRRMLPVLGAQQPFRLALARLYGSAMEVGQLAASAGQPPLADQAFQAAAAAAERLGRPAAAGEALARLGELRLALSVPQAATAALDLAEQFLEKGDQKRSLGRVALLRAEVQIQQGDLATAVTELKRGMALLEGLQDRAHMALGGLRLGRLLYEQGKLEAAKLALSEAVQNADASRDPRPIAATRMAQAFVLGEQGDLQEAMQLLNQAASAFQAAGMPPHVVEVAAAGLQRRDGQAALAQARLHKMAEVFQQAKAMVQWADAQHEVGRCLVDQKLFEEAEQALSQTLEVRTRARDRFAMLRVYEDLAAAFEGLGQLEAAYTHLALGRALAERLGLARHLGRLDAQIANLRLPKESDAQALRDQAAQQVAALEEGWANPPQAAPEGEAQAH